MIEKLSASWILIAEALNSTGTVCSLTHMEDHSLINHWLFTDQSLIQGFFWSSSVHCRMKPPHITPVSLCLSAALTWIYTTWPHKGASASLLHRSWSHRHVSHYLHMEKGSEKVLLLWKMLILSTVTKWRSTCPGLGQGETHQLLFRQGHLRPLGTRMVYRACQRAARSSLRPRDWKLPFGFSSALLFANVY